MRARNPLRMPGQRSSCAAFALETTILSRLRRSGHRFSIFSTRIA
ncbi:hypothetical protein CP157_03672 (plasmid) [Paracoccus marcusii]|nr:hypothetical protein CP157_03672 [Paracoccus marcusii]